MSVFFCVHTHKLGFIVLAHEMQNAERKVQNWDLSYCLVVVASFPIPCHCAAAFAAVAISRYNLATIIALKIEVSDKMCYTSNIFRHPAFYQEIATSLRSSQ